MRIRVGRPIHGPRVFLLIHVCGVWGSQKGFIRMLVRQNSQYLPVSFVFGGLKQILHFFWYTKLPIIISSSEMACDCLKTEFVTFCSL